MASLFINTWVKDIQKKIDYWYNNFTLTPHVFRITLLPAAPVINPNILNHNITSCCPSPQFPPISFEHFPEPYYGNPDDDIEKLAVCLFYNPGPQGADQHITARGTGTFYNNYAMCGNNYNMLSSTLSFCVGTINRFWIPKTNQLLNLFNCLNFKKEDLNPLFIDLIPWHSNTFKDIDFNRFATANTLQEVKNNVLIPAILNANNSSISHYLNSINKTNNKIVLFAIGAKYSRNNYLTSLGFQDITSTIPNNLPNTVIVNGDIHANGPNKIVKIWKIKINNLISQNIDLHHIKDKEVYIINLWTRNVGMNIPQGICDTLDHILNTI